jgi:Spy/CpxP family protein refolding chaperone
VSVAAIAMSRGGQRPLFWAVLALSLALNLCFIGGALWIRFQGLPTPMGPEERLQQIGPQLGLDPRQKLAFDQYAHALGTQMHTLHGTVEPLIGHAWAEIAKPEADEAKIIELFGQAGDMRRAFRRELVTSTLSFLATLSPEQRAKFVELARQRPWAKRHQDGAP